MFIKQREIYTISDKSGLHLIHKRTTSSYNRCMEKNLEPHKALQHLSTQLDKPVWSSGNHAVTGILHKRQLKARTFPSGVCVAIQVDWPLAQVASACLLLASNPDVCDDSLYVEQQQVWLLRRYPLELNEVEFDLVFQQQLMMAELLKPRGTATVRHHTFTGRYA